MGKIPTKTQVSSGGVAFREQAGRIEIALIAVDSRWQLPKGMVNKDEATEAAARREVREETGLETELVKPIDKIELDIAGDEVTRYFLELVPLARGEIELKRQDFALFLQHGLDRLQLRLHLRGFGFVEGEAGLKSKLLVF